MSEPGSTESGHDSPFQPLYVLADSQLLFRRGGEGSVLDDIARRRLPEDPRAAYLGAANDDDPAFYDLFAGAVEAAGIHQHAMVRSAYGEADRQWLESAHLVVLAGGDAGRAWRIFEQTGIREALLARYAAGAVLLGVSAGAVHLGWDHLNLVPALIGAHEEADDWAALRRRVEAARPPVRGLGIPFGAGLVCHPDGTIEALRHPITELVPAEGGVSHSLLLPPQRGPSQAIH
ncbi:MAG TPA: Type 1 glutamine amidotransferase-like domain-containing protein [Thermoanaerobaculia bacterium]|nr:Type 1 glutamine amidotransferase-like domain-containing protein [Thermoanaerobaculia bacterium]